MRTASACTERLEGRVLFAAGDLDTTFGGGDGIASLDSSDPFDSTEAMAVAGDGSIVAVGRTNTPPDGFSVVVTRYHSDGTPDESFGGDGDGDGRAVLGNLGGPYRVVVDAEGRTVIATQADYATNGGINAQADYHGSDSMYVVRLKRDGSLDTSFGGDGKAFRFFSHSTEITALKAEDDGKIVVGFIMYAPVPDPSESSMRFNADGSVDPSYRGGVVAKDDGGLGGIGAYDFRVPDEFAEGPVKAARVSSPALAAVRQPDGKIVTLDHAENEYLDVSPHVAVLRFNADGTVDPTFAHAVHPGGSHTIAVQPGTGRIIYEGGRHLAVIGVQSAPPLAEPRPVPESGPEPAADTTPPSAALVAVPEVTAATTGGIEFVVHYTDEVSVDRDTFDRDDVRVTAPDGSSAPADGMGAVTQLAFNDFEVTYRYTPAGGGFTAAMNGAYTVSVEPGQVFDLAENAAAAVTIGNFNVNIPADGPNLAVGAVTTRLRNAGTFYAGGRGAGRVSVVVNNAGNRAARSKVRVSLLASADATADAADVPVVAKSLRLALRAGRRRVVAVRLRRMPASLAAGSYFLLARVEPGAGADDTTAADNASGPADAKLTIVAARAGTGMRWRKDILVSPPPSVLGE